MASYLLHEEIAPTLLLHLEATYASCPAVQPATSESELLIKAVPVQLETASSTDDCIGDLGQSGVTADSATCGGPAGSKASHPASDGMSSDAHSALGPEQLSAPNADDSFRVPLELVPEKPDTCRPEADGGHSVASAPMPEQHEAVAARVSILNHPMAVEPGTEDEHSKALTPSLARPKAVESGTDSGHNPATAPSPWRPEAVMTCRNGGHSAAVAPSPEWPVKPGTDKRLSTVPAARPDAAKGCSPAPVHSLEQAEAVGPAADVGRTAALAPLPEEQPQAIKPDADDGRGAVLVPRLEVPKAVKPDADLCAFCFQVILARLRRLPVPRLRGQWLETAECLVPGLFVTWRTSTAGLRGCMGSLSPVNLEQGLADYTLMSCLQDKRFKPMRTSEMATVTCQVSILHSFEPCKDVYDWKVGVHGVQVAFAARPLLPPACYEAVFLPEVVVEAGMTHQLAIMKLAHKAGYFGQCDEALLRRMKVTRFQSHVSELRYSDLCDRS